MEHRADSNSFFGFTFSVVRDVCLGHREHRVCDDLILYQYLGFTFLVLRGVCHRRRVSGILASLFQSYGHREHRVDSTSLLVLSFQVLSFHSSMPWE